MTGIRTMTPSISVGAATHVGRVRDHNEDALHVQLPSVSGDRAGTGVLLIVCDGVGGLEAGDVAAHTAVRAACEAFNIRLGAERREAMQYAVQSAHAAVQQIQSQRAMTMASTIVMAAIQDGRLSVANVGDSRCYLLRDGRLKQLSTDHSWIGAQVRAGVLTPEEAKKSVYQNVLTRSLGLKTARVEADFAQLEWQAGDKLLLCSDGVWNLLSDDRLTKVLTHASTSAQQAAETLVQAANAAGGSDNITAVVAFDASQPTLVIRRPTPTWARAAALGGLVVALAVAAWIVTQVIHLPSGARIATDASAPEAVFASATPLPTATAVTSIAGSLATAVRTATPMAGAETDANANTSDLTDRQRAGSPVLAVTQVPSIQFCRQAAVSNSQCQASESRFKTRPAGAPDSEVFAVWGLDDLHGASSVTMQWTVNGVPRAGVTCTVSNAKCLESQVSPVQTGIATTESGDYRLDVIADGQPVLTGSFTVE